MPIGKTDFSNPSPKQAQTIQPPAPHPRPDAGALTFAAFEAEVFRTISLRGDQHWFERIRANGNKVDLLHAVLGLASEVGEFADPIKRAMFYGKEIDLDVVINLREEAGDLLWYIAGPVCRALNCSLSDLAQGNMDKLNKRYPTGYSPQAALARADKQGEAKP